MRRIRSRGHARTTSRRVRDLPEAASKRPARGLEPLRGSRQAGCERFDALLASLHAARGRSGTSSRQPASGVREVRDVGVPAARRPTRGSTSRSPGRRAGRRFVSRCPDRRGRAALRAWRRGAGADVARPPTGGPPPWRRGASRRARGPLRGDQRRSEGGAGSGIGVLRGVCPGSRRRTRRARR